MFSCADISCGYWWLFPVGMMLLCFFLMRGRMGSMMCGPHRRGNDTRGEGTGGSALDTLNKRYARGGIAPRNSEDPCC
jgi:uncharacterized membrane protein